MMLSLGDTASRFFLFNCFIFSLLFLLQRLPKFDGGFATMTLLKVNF